MWFKSDIVREIWILVTLRSWRVKASRNNPNEYMNWKSFHSIVLQGVADANGKFLHVSTGYTGSIHDAHVLWKSSFSTSIGNGDMLYSPMCQIWHRGKATQRDFSKSQSIARVVIEQSFGLLNMRWRCSLDKLDESEEKVCSTIITCCILQHMPRCQWCYWNWCGQ